MASSRRNQSACRNPPVTNTPHASPLLPALDWVPHMLMVTTGSSEFSSAVLVLVNRPIFPHSRVCEGGRVPKRQPFLTSSAPVVNEKTPARLLTFSGAH